MKNKDNFKPYLPADKIVPEFTFTAVFLGILMAIIFGGANAYLGLRVGMTVSASIPAAVISMGIIRFILKRNSILENNIAQTIGSAGESLAAGAIFTLPVLFMWANEGLIANPGLLKITLIALCGGILAVLFMIPLRNALIVQEHGTLPYPEGTACAEVLLAAEKGGSSAKRVFTGLGISALYKFIADGLKIFPSQVDYTIKGYKGSGIGIDVLPALAGVGYICGIRISSYLFAGGFIAWFCIMPLIALFGSDIILYPGTIPVSQMDSWDIWSTYIRYIGAGAVAAGGIISLIKSMPLIISTFKKAIKGVALKSESTNRLNKDLPINFVLIGISIIAVAMWLIPAIPVNLLGAVIIIVLGFFFATVSSRMVGIVGSSNNPVSGMAIATLIIASMLLKADGNIGIDGMIGAITTSSIICIIAAIAGDTSQDLKTGYIIGASPVKQQIGELVGVIISAITIGATLYLFNKAWGFGSTEIAAPQATLMKMVVEGVFGGSLPWNLIFIGISVAIVMEILKIPVLPFAVGLYLPIHLSTPMIIGGLIRYLVERKNNPQANVENGILYSSGLIAGEGVIGILLAVFAIIPLNTGSLADAINISHIISLGNIGGLILFSLLSISIYLSTKKEFNDEE